MPARMLRAAALAALLAATAISSLKAEPQKPPTLDYDFFKSRVQAVFLQKRATHARCYVCHAESNNAFRLEKLSSDARTWNDEQSRRNFETVSKLVNPGDPDSSRLTLHPLAIEGGGDVYHSGGRQFASKRDPAWRTLAAWINGATLASPKK
ncbi:MAG TPA: hypothetical protein VFB45_12760 [Pseudolabrys sp.]|nr:hypothetical protein [Pseudolabrys sp.]